MDVRTWKVRGWMRVVVGFGLGLLLTVCDEDEPRLEPVL